MPLKKKAPAKKAVLGPKAKLMKLSVTTLRSKAKALGVSDVTKRPKENLAVSIMLAEARKKRGTTPGKKATAKRSANPNRQIDVPPKGSDRYWADASKRALAPGRRTSKSGKVYYERRANRSDVPGTFAGFSNTNDLSRLGYREAGSLGEMLTAWADQNLTTLAREYFDGLKDWGFNTQSGFVYLTDEDYNVLMYNNSVGALDLFLFTPSEGMEGFIEDLLQEFEYLDDDDKEFVANYWSKLSPREKKIYKKPNF
jgi:hypothetical protein